VSAGLVDRSAQVSLRKIDISSEHVVTELCVASDQRSYVAPNKKSLDDAKGNPGSWLRLICADQIPVGFVLLFMPFLPGAIARPQIQLDQIALWRFMIDQRYQRMGFGHQALELVRVECQRHSGVRQILSSYVPGLHGPEKFYLSHGFTKTGNLRAGGSEVEIVFRIE
jgi:diamine N-acetyltransferase